MVAAWGLDYYLREWHSKGVWVGLEDLEMGYLHT